MNKMTLLADTVLRRNQEGLLFLMHRKVGGVGARAIPIESTQWLLDHYQVRVGAWSRDEEGEFCPVTRVAQDEQPTPHDGEEVLKLHDFGQRGSRGQSVLSSEHSVIAPFLHEGLTEGEAIKALMGGHVRTVVFGVGGSLIHGGGDPEKSAMKVRMDSGPFPEGTLVPVMIDGEVVRDPDSVEEIRARVLEGESSKRAYQTFVEDTDWDAISDALDPEGT